MEIFLVGGAVRDALLGLPVHDRDYVVVGSNAGEMLARGFQSVGKDFPVFLHPTTHEAYALARTERKTATGYQGFAFHAAADVTLEQDLARRDFTINSIAVKPRGSWTNESFCLENLGDWIVVDPYGGQADLQAGVLRHVTDSFGEDPVRILRLARFSARFSRFSVAPQTMQLMQAMVNCGEVDALVAERVWQELSRGLMEDKPSRLLDNLSACGAWQQLLPEWPIDAHTGTLLDVAAAEQVSLDVRFAVLMQRVWQPTQAVASHDASASGGAAAQARTAPWRSAAQRLRVPTDCQSLAGLVLQEADAFGAAWVCSPRDLVALLERCDAWRRPDRMAKAIQAWRLRLGQLANADPGACERRVALALEACKRVNAQAVAAKAQADCLQSAAIATKQSAGSAIGHAIAHALHEARVAAASGALVP